MDINSLIGVFDFYTGSMIGSFLNVCIVASTLWTNLLFFRGAIVWPAARPIANGMIIFTLISWLLLGGRCRACKRKNIFPLLVVWNYIVNDDCGLFMVLSPLWFTVSFVAVSGHGQWFYCGDFR